MNDLYIRSQSFEDVFVPPSYTLALGKDPSSLGDAGEVMAASMTVDLTRYVTGYVTGCTALAMNGMSQFPHTMLHIITTNSSLHGEGTGRFKFIYDPGYDTENFLDYPLEENKGLLVPNAERSLLDYMRFGYYMSLEHLFMGMRDYLLLYGGTWDKLYKMADFYSMPHSLIDNWVEEYEEAELH